MSDYTPALCLGIALSACCGFRVFIPLLITGLAARFDLIALSAGSEWLSSTPALITLLVACGIEIIAYYIPVVDNLLDSIAIPTSIAAGSIVAASVFTEFDPLIKWTVAIVAGGDSAGIIQTGTSLARLGSTKLTAGVGNFVLSSVENIISIGGTILSLLLPVVMFMLFLGLIGGLAYAMLKVRR